MGVRFRGQIKTTHTNTDYTVELWDVNYTTTGVTNIILFGEGFQITYEGQGDEIYAPIKGSACKVYAGVTNDSAGLALRTWIYNSILATKEDQYHVAIYKDGNLHWFGVILPSLGNEPDDSRPYDFVIQATDGLARLKDKEYTPAATAYTDPTVGRRTFIEILYEVLKATPLYMATSEALLFTTCVGYYEDTMPTKDSDIDPLAYSKIRESVFLILEENKEPLGQSYYEVLAQICESWGLRVMLSDGLFRFYQIQSYNDDAVERWERYYTRETGEYIGFFEFTGYRKDLEAAAIPSVVNGNQWEFYDPLKYVYLKFPFSKDSNMLDELETMTNNGPYNWFYKTDLRDYLVGGAGRKLNFATSLRVTMSGRFNDFVIVNIKIKLGNLYLSKPFTSTIATWSTNPGARYNIVINNVIGPTTFNYNIAVQTPDIPAGTYLDNEFQLDALIRQAALGNVFTASRQLGSTSLSYNSSSNSENENYFEYIGGNTNTPINSYDLELEDTYIGETLDFGPGHIFVSPNGTIFSPSTASWRLEGSGAKYDFCLIRVRDVLTAQTISTRKYQGAILGSMINAHNSIEYDNKIYLINGAVYSAMNERWEGEWIEVDYARASWQEIQGATAQAGPGGDTQLRREIGDISYRDNLGNLQLKSVISQQEISVLTTEATGTFSSISFGVLSYEVREGDYLRILTPDGGGNEVVRATADSTGSFVSIDTTTTTGGLPEGSAVLFDLTDIIERVRLGTVKVFTFDDDVTLEPFSQNVVIKVENKTVTLPLISECYSNGRSVEICIKMNDGTSSHSGTINVDGNGYDIETSGTTEVSIKNLDLMTFFTDGFIWQVKNHHKNL
jgi:hypothetical protein